MDCNAVVAGCDVSSWSVWLGRWRVHLTRPASSMDAQVPREARKKHGELGHGSSMDGPGAGHREGTHPPPAGSPISELYSIENCSDRTVEEVGLESQVHSPGNASAGCGVARETRYLIILSVGSPGEPCYDARATASSPRILLPGVGAWAAFFIRQITFQPSAPGPTPLARNPPNQSVNQQVHSCPSRPATKRQRPRQLPPSSSIHHHSSTNDPTHVSRAPSATSVNFQTTLTTQPKTPSKCLPSPPTRSPPPRPPLPPRLPRRRMPLARRLPRLARRRSAPRRGRRPTPPTSTRVSSFSSTIWTRIQSRHSTFSVR